MDPRYRTLKRTGWGLFTLFFLFIVFIVISDWDEVNNDDENYKRIEIEGSTIYGYESGRKSWEITSSYIWAGRSQFLFRLDDVVNGGLYDKQGRKVLDYLTAKSVQVNSKSQTLVAQKDVSAVLVGRQDILGNVQPGAQSTEVLISSQRLKYFNLTKKAYLTGDVLIQQDTAKIKVKDEVVYDVSTNIAVIENGVYYESDEFQVTADRMVIYLDEEYAIFDGNIYATRKVLDEEYVDVRENSIKSKFVYLRADHLEYRSISSNINLMFEGNVHLYQSDKQIRGEWVTYDKDADYFEIKGDVFFQTDSLSWLIDSSRKDQFSNSDFIETIEKSVSLNCESLVFKPELNQLDIKGPLRLLQDDMKLIASRATYEDENGILNFYGRVVVDKNDSDQLNSSFLSIHVIDEIVEAENNVIEFEWDD